MKIVMYGLTITSSWGNGHATTYRSLCRALSRRGHRITFVEKDVEWYRSNRDLPRPDFCNVHLYQTWSDDTASLLALSQDADVILIGSYFPDAIELIQRFSEQRTPPVLFYDIDTPITVSHLRATGATSYLRSDLIPAYSAYLSFTGGPLLQELEAAFKARRALPFYCSVDPEIYEPSGVSAAFGCDLSYLGTYAPDRQPALSEFIDKTASLDPSSRFIVAGPQYPADLNWQPNVRRIVHLAPSDHPSFYSSSRFTLNLTRHEMIVAGWSPSVRLFEAAACGVPILSDTWEGLDSFFTPNEEILTPARAEDVVDILRNYTQSGRDQVGRRARDRVLSEHTSEHRAIQFEEIVSTCGTG